jgi:RsiW-degrading membrane proteinase PrsW (M82 family)
VAGWARFAVVRLWVSLAWVVGLLAFLPDVRGPVRAYAGSFMLLAVWFTLTRTKTVGWRVVAEVFTASVAWSGVIGWATVAVARGVGLTPAADGSAAALAGFLEESGKLVPLIVLAVAAPGRVRRFAATDWAVLGFACGVGFNAFEDALRQTAALVTPVLIPAQWTKDYSLNPWTSATFQTTDGLAVAPGHHLWTATIAMAVGLGIALWRSSRSASARSLAVVLPGVVLMVAIAEHAGFNAHNADPHWPATGGEGFPAVLSGLWSATGHGRAITVLSVVFLVASLLVDSHRRHVAARDAIGTCARPPGVVVPGVGTGDGAARWWNARVDAVAPGLTAGRTWKAVRRCGELVIRAVAQGIGDLGIVLAAHTPQRDESRLATVRRARQIATRVRLARSEAMAATTPGTEPAARRRFAITAAVVGILTVLACAVWGAHIAVAIGPWLNLDADGSFLAGLLDAVGDWWDGLGTGGQILVGVGAAALVVLSGGSLGVAFGIAGVATYGLDKAHGLATFTRNPAQATADYLATTTPVDFLMDTGEFALTFAPGNFAGAAIARGGRSAVREFVTDPDAFLAARREVLSGDAGSVSFRGHLDDVPPGPSPVDAPPAAQPPGLEVTGSGFSASERSAAEFIADQGRSVVLRQATGAGRMSDLLVDGVPYDVYSPRTGSLDRIVGAIAEKGSQVRGGGVVLDLSGSPLRASDVGDLLARVQGVTGSISDIIVMGG